MPLEGGGVLVCHDGSLVSLLELDGSRSMVGTEELDRFVDVAALRLNTAFAHSGHALHVVFERSPDERKASLARMPRPRGGMPDGSGSTSTTCWPSGRAG